MTNGLRFLLTCPDVASLSSEHPVERSDVGMRISQIDYATIFGAVLRFLLAFVISPQSVGHHQLKIGPRNTPEDIIHCPLIPFGDRVYLPPNATSPVGAIRSALVCWEIVTRSVFTDRIADKKSA